MIKNSLLLLLLLSFSIIAFSQTEKPQKAVITLPEINVVADKIDHPLVFSTFTWSPFKTSGIQYVESEVYVGSMHNFGIAAIKVDNDHDLIMRIDSLYIKGKGLDSNSIKLFFSVYQNGKLYASSLPKLRHSGKRINKFVFEKELLLPKGVSYFSFSFSAKKVMPFKIYTNRNIEGYLYSYNTTNDIFKLLDPMNKLDVGIYCPQIKLFYTLVAKP